MTQVVLIFEKRWKIVKMIIFDTGWWNMGIYYTVLTNYVYDWNFHNKMFKSKKRKKDKAIIRIRLRYDIDVGVPERAFKIIIIKLLRIINGKE